MASTMPGKSSNGGGTYDGFLYNGGVISTFAVPNAIGTIPFDINSSGQIVGYSTTNS